MGSATSSLSDSVSPGKAEADFPQMPLTDGKGKGTWQMSAAFFFAGFGTFALIYNVQPLLPEFPTDFSVSPATASLALSLTTLMLSATMLIVGRISEIVNRRQLMSGSIVIASVIGIASAFSPGWEVFLALRALEGVALGGLPAVALAYLSDNVPHHRLASTVGLYVSGTAFGGMAGRLLGGILSNNMGWRHTVGIVAVVCLVMGVLFFFALPAQDQRRMAEESGSSLSSPWKNLLRRFVEQWRDPTLRRLFIEGGFLLGCFVATYNYLCFRLLAEPFSFSQGQVSLVFLMYFSGMIVSPLIGKLIQKFSVSRVLKGSFLAIALGSLISIIDSLPFILLGLLFLTTGFFAGHSTASAWVNRRADTGKSIASAQYLTTYYIGASLLGWLGGFAWQDFRWVGVVGVVAGGALVAFFLVPREGMPRATKSN